MEMRKASSRRLTPHDWAAEALAAIARGGIDAVAVERIAAELGATKGSFYWHFENRDALVEAALALWEKLRTDAVIEYLAADPDPARRLRMLLEGGFERAPGDRVEIALLSNPSHPIALRTIRRVVKRRIDYVRDQFEALGWEPDEARDRAALIAYLYVGRMQLGHIAPKVTDTAARKRQVDLVFEALVGPRLRASALLSTGR
jgi:AcrR family transcriptional regulator